jgi:succinoglycan biosynthesis protein ExoO
LIFARDPKVYLAAARGGAARAFAWLGLSAGWLNARPAPYAPAAPLTTEDRLYVARRIRGRAGVLIADYAWQTEALAYALSPRARTAVIMHDLFYRRAQLFPDQVGGDPVTALDRESEIGLLARADTIIAIQKTEAAAVAKRLSWRSVLVVPMTARPAAAPQPGDAGKVLFVASNTAPNLLGLTWMLERVWPRVRSALPHLELIVAGSVCRGLPPPMGGVRYLGFVDRLDRLYAEAGLVVSPLTAGSGLKIKLIEALAHGKACVATSVTLQGVEDEVGHAVAVADPPEAFAAAMVRLLSDRAARVQLGAAGLEAVRTSFSADQRHAEFVRWLSGRVPAKQDRPLREAVAAASEAQLTES